MGSAVTSKSERPPELFLAFPDGVYDYVCAECTALCCKGHGFAGSLERDMRPLFRRYPELQTMVLERQGDRVLFATTVGGCIMLDHDNLCRIEKDLGKESKPTVCKLFPFNSFTRVGKTVVVTPHFLCPLRLVTPARPGSVQGSHAQIESDIRKSQILDPDYLKNVVPAMRVHSSLSELQVIKREQAFRELCANGLGTDRFNDILLTVSRDPNGLRAFVRRACRILGYESVAPHSECDTFDTMLLAFASVYRTALLDLESEQILRALAIAEIMGRRAWSGASPLPTFQGFAHGISTFRPVHVLLATGDDPFEFGNPSKKTFVFGDPELVFAAFVAVRNSASGVLYALEEAIPQEMTVADRSALLMRLGETMHRIRLKQTRKHRAVIEKVLTSQDEESPKA